MLRTTIVPFTTEAGYLPSGCRLRLKRDCSNKFLEWEIKRNAKSRK